MSFFDIAKKFFLDLLFPIFCLGCHKEETWLCQSCFSKIKPDKNQTCPKCQRKTVSGRLCKVCSAAFKLEGVVIASSYKNELLKSAIHVFKYRFAKELVVPLSQLLIHALENNFSFLAKAPWLKNTILVPIPLHKRRFNWRGFNQAELLARSVGKKFGLPVLRLLKKIKNTTPQTQLNILERHENIKGAFLCKNGDLIFNKTVILVDDVFTTGATLEECAKTLLPFKPKEIWGLVLAKG